MRGTRRSLYLGAIYERNVVLKKVGRKKHVRKGLVANMCLFRPQGNLGRKKGETKVCLKQPLKMFSLDCLCKQIPALGPESYTCYFIAGACFGAAARGAILLLCYLVFQSVLYIALTCSETNEKLTDSSTPGNGNTKNSENTSLT